MDKKYYGTRKDGQVVSLYTLRNKLGMEASFLDFGAIWLSMQVPDRRGQMTEIVLSHDDLEGYEDNGDMFGAFVGRVANRTEKGRFTLDGREYQLECNDGENNLHSSNTHGFHKMMWEAESFSEDGVTFTHFSPDGACGFPGNMKVSVTYTLTDTGSLMVSAEAICDKRSIINLTQHAYFNLKGMGRGDCMDTELWINADQYTPVRAGGIPTGEILSLEGTPLDFSSRKPIGRDFLAGHEQQKLVGGYDHNFVIKGPGRGIRKAAEAVNPQTGICMTVYHDQPGLQLYTGNYISVKTGRGGAVLGPYSGFCLETHGFTNAINTPGFPSPVIEANAVYRTNTIYQFTTDYSMEADNFQ